MSCLEKFLIENTKKIKEKTEVLRQETEKLREKNKMLQEQLETTINSSGEPKTYTVNLSYFKPNGSFYSEGSFEIESQFNVYQIVDKVVELRKTGKLPGLIEKNTGYEYYTVLINTPQHPSNFPNLIMGK
jgi:hypothetical protein